MGLDRDPLPPSATTHPGIEAEQPCIDSSTSPAGCLALCILWSAREPERVGEVALLPPWLPLFILGRCPSSAVNVKDGPVAVEPPNSAGAPSAQLDGEPMVFFRQRPLGTTDAGSPERARIHLAGEAISRRQLSIRPAADGRTLAIENIGRCELSVNGKVVTKATVQAGDTLYLHNQLLLYCTYRPKLMTPLRAYPAGRCSRFGKADRDGMVGESPAMWSLRERLASCARSEFHVLIIGGSGSGKELAAQAIHAMSERGAKKLVADNIAAIPPSLASALLFGNKRNFPNPGMDERVGLIGAAHGSTLFLDEIGDMPEAVQPLFLRVAESNGEYFRLGDEHRPQRSDFRLVGATNHPDKMRHELRRRFQREIAVPDLNERKEDIPLLIRHLLELQCAQDSDVERFLRAGHPHVHPRLVEQLVHHHFRTHVSEINFLLGQAIAESDHDLICPLGSGLRIERSQSPTAKPAQRLMPRPLPTVQRAQQLLDELGGDITRTAACLDISRDQLNRMIRREGLTVLKRRSLRLQTDTADSLVLGMTKPRC